MSEIQKPSVGRVVLIKRKDGSPVSNGQPAAPALVQTAWESDSINACMFPDCGTPTNVTSIPHEDRIGEGYGGYVWSWPPRV